MLLVTSAHMVVFHEVKKAEADLMLSCKPPTLHPLPIFIAIVVSPSQAIALGPLLSHLGLKLIKSGFTCFTDSLLVYYLSQEKKM